MDIRKLSVGPNYKEAMHYLIDQPVVGGTYRIHLIKKTTDSYQIWISNGEVTYLWKEYKDVPTFIEYNINF